MILYILFGIQALINLVFALYIYQVVNGLIRVIQLHTKILEQHNSVIFDQKEPPCSQSHS